jgi:hypothetical protein
MTLGSSRMYWSTHIKDRRPRHLQPNSIPLSSPLTVYLVDPNMKVFSIAAALAAVAPVTLAGPIAYGLCQTGGLGYRSHLDSTDTHHRL